MARNRRSWMLPVARACAGLLVGLPAAFLAGLLGRWLGALRIAPGDWRDLVGGIVGGAVGYLVGVAFGVGWVSGHRRAAIAFALLGGALGGAGALVIGALLGADRAPASSVILCPFAVPIGASGTLGVTIDRWKPDDASSGQ